MNSTPPEVGIEKEYSQGVCEDGAAILCDGQPLSIEEILQGLRERDKALGKLAAMESKLAVAVMNERGTVMNERGTVMTRSQCDDDETFEICCRAQTPLYAHPIPQSTARITEQDAREILLNWDSYRAGSRASGVTPSHFKKWMDDHGQHLLNKLNADRGQVPAVAVPDALQKLRLEVAEAINILAMCGDQTPADQLGKKLAAALNASAPSHSQQSADAVKAFCKDIGLYDPAYDDQGYIEVSRHKLKEHVESLYDRCPSHESSILEFESTDTCLWEQEGLEKPTDRRFGTQIHESALSASPAPDDCCCGDTAESWRLCPAHSEPDSEGE